MKHHNNRATNRRSFLRQALGSTLLPMAAQNLVASKAKAAAATASRPADRRFLIIMQGTGGASIIDSFMAIDETLVTAAGGDPTTLNCFAKAQLFKVDGSPFTAVDYTGNVGTLANFKVDVKQSTFLKAHASEMQVITQEGTSITHLTAQKRAITGNEAWHGRTLQECCATAFGDQLPIPNLLLGVGGFIEAGADDSLNSHARGMIVADPLSWSRSLSSTFGLTNIPSAELIEMARSSRDDVDSNSKFFQTFMGAPNLRDWINYRSTLRQQYEAGSLAANLAVSKDNPAATELLALFPDYATDGFEAQAVLACLAITQDIACTVTLGPSFSVVTSGGLESLKNPPIAFDFSHANHRGVQAMMWNRILSVTDRMITYLKSKEYVGGSSFWDHSLVYFATDFGRGKHRPASADSWSTSHDLNNGQLIVSPLVKGNTLLGGVDPATALTYGFDPLTGAPTKGTNMEEKQIFCGVLQALGIDTAAVPGATDMRAMRKA